MSSSISSSEAHTFRLFLRFFGICSSFFVVSTFALLVIADPYGTGRLTPFDWRNMYDTGPRMAHPNRIRDPSFDSAIIGNSTMQLLSPERLDAATRQRFVQLSVPGTGPKEQVAVINNLIWQRGSSLKTLVLGLGYAWCDPGRAISTVDPFPFWLYDTNALVYASGLFRMDSLEALPRRFRLLMGREKPGRRDGYWDYELIPGGYQRFEANQLVVPQLPTRPGQQKSAASTLRTLLASLPANLQVLLVHPPVFSPDPPQMTPDARAALGACKDELVHAAATRPATQMIDGWVDDENTRKRYLFFDHDHYRSGMAVLVEHRIASAMTKPQ